MHTPYRVVICSVVLAAAGAGFAAAPPAQPGTVGRALQFRLPAADSAVVAPVPDTNRAGLSSTPKLRKAVDVPVPQVDQVTWSPDGKAIAIRAVEWPEVQTSPQGLQTQGPPKRNVVVVIPDVSAPDPRFLTIDLPRAGKLVGFTPDGKQVITDLREYNLVSGFHKLSFWEETPPGPVPPEQRGAARLWAMKLARTVDLDADQTRGYYFAPDGKTFRTVYHEEARSNRSVVYSKLEVREVSATTGDTLRTLFKADGTYKTYTLSGDGGRLAAVDAETDRLGVWDVTRGEKVSAYDLPPDKEDDQAGGPRGGRVTDTDRTPTLLFSPDGRRVVCFREPRVSVALNADTGEPLPALEHADRVMATGGLTVSGRLLVASGNRVTEERRSPAVARGGDPAGRGNPRAGGFPGAAGPGGGAAWGGTTQVVRSYSNFVGVWDTVTGKRLRGWDRAAHVVVHPTRPVVAILESNGEGGVRLGLWDFAADTPGKK